MGNLCRVWRSRLSINGFPSWLERSLLHPCTLQHQNNNILYKEYDTESNGDRQRGNFNLSCLRSLCSKILFFLLFYFVIRDIISSVCSVLFTEANFRAQGLGAERGNYNTSVLIDVCHPGITVR